MIQPLVAVVMIDDDGELLIEADDDDLDFVDNDDLIGCVDALRRMNLWNRRACLFPVNLELIENIEKLKFYFVSFKRPCNFFCQFQTNTQNNVARKKIRRTKYIVNFIQIFT